MKPTYKKYFKILAAAAVCLPLTGCIEETFPQSDYLTQDQVNQQDNAVDGFLNSIIGLPAQTGLYSSTSYFDIGYPGLGMMRDVFAEDFSVYQNTYDYFGYHSSNTYLGEYVTSDFVWYLYYKYIAACNNVLRTELTESESRRQTHGIAHAYRALYYLDLTRMYEFKNTGFDEIDGQAKANQIYGLTVPLIQENTDEATARNIPRATWYEAARFILDDLDMAEELLSDMNRTSKHFPDLGVVNGLRARLWLDIATRFEQNPSAPAEATQAGVDLGANDAKAAYAKAAKYADDAIAKSGATPMTKAQWNSTGFNSLDTPSWMLGISINKELLSGNSWAGWIAYATPFTLYGESGLSDAGGYLANIYTTQRLISTALYKEIPTNDWRRTTWIDPADAGNPKANSKYDTYVSNEFFALLPELCGLKFKPASNETVDYSIGSAVDYPLMRVEEMYFIKAEALAASQGVGAGAAVLNDFISTHRYSSGSYSCNTASLEDFRKDLMIQKRIEFWGEGQVYYDYKRLNLQVMRGYEGTNFPENYRLNSNEGYCAPWMTMYIMKMQIGLNQALKPNPDPSTVNCLWEE